MLDRDGPGGKAGLGEQAEPGGPGEQALEVAVVGDRIAVRDSKQRGGGPVLEFTATEWAAFLAGVRGGEFDLRDG